MIASPPAPPRLATGLLCLALVTLWTLRTSPAQTCADGPPFSVGTVTVMEACEDTGPLPDTTCVTVVVACDGLSPLQAQVRITEPLPGTTPQGTVLFGSGGGGTDFYSDDPGGALLMEGMASLGFRVVERRWATSWFSTDSGVRRQSCRYATLATWVHETVHAGGSFCVTGNSGGSAEIGYALTSWGLDVLVDVAVPTGGPPMTRLDWFCPEPPPAPWLTQCAELPPPGVMACQPACDLSTSANGPVVCTSCSRDPSPGELWDDSILHPLAQTDYPSTRVHFVWGTQDCTIAVPAGLLWAGAITSEVVTEFAPGTPHATFTTSAGRQAISSALLAGASCSTGPATVNGIWPRLAGTLELTIAGPPGDGYVLAVGFDHAIAPLPPYGTLFLAQPLVLGSGTLDASTGEALVSIPVPGNPSLVGLDVYNQALSGPCLTNVLHVVVLP